jgi:hypothetical protein
MVMPPSRRILREGSKSQSRVEVNYLIVVAPGTIAVRVCSRNPALQRIWNDYSLSAWDRCSKHRDGLAVRGQQPDKPARQTNDCVQKSEKYRQCEGITPGEAKIAEANNEGSFSQPPTGNCNR